MPYNADSARSQHLNNSSTQTYQPSICRETGCEMDANCPSYRICSQPRWKTQQQYTNARNKAISVNPLVIHLQGLEYAVENSKGGWEQVTLDSRNGGEVEGAQCTCDGQSHPFCYHRMAAWLYHIKRFLVLAMFQIDPQPQPENFKTSEPLPTPASAPDGEPGPKCVKCGDELTAKNKGRGGLCKFCLLENFITAFKDLVAD